MFLVSTVLVAPQLDENDFVIGVCLMTNLCVLGYIRPDRWLRAKGLSTVAQGSICQISTVGVGKKLNCGGRSSPLWGSVNET